MKRKKIESHNEEQIVTAMVTSKEFLCQVYPSLDVNLFQSKHLKHVAKWCKDYYTKYKEAPKQNIESVYHTWVENGRTQPEVVDAVHDVLERLSNEYEDADNQNIPYLLDMAGRYLTKRRIEILKDQLEYNLAQGDQNAAEFAIVSYSSVRTGLGEGIDPLNNDEAWDAAYAESQKPLITWGNKDADFFFAHSLTRDGLIGVLAPEKRGKTWWCVEFAMRAVSQRKKVALFEVGDMSQSQIMRRLGVRLSNRPMFRRDLGLIEIPKSIFREDGDIDTEIVQYEYNRIARAQSSKKAVKRFMRRSGIRPGRTHIMVSIHPNSSVNVTDLSSILDKWEMRMNFIPDIIIIDYPDILLPEPGTSGYSTRDQVNETWKAMRRMSQQRHCLVIAPTQADAASYNVELLTASNFSEDKRKLAHVTGMLGLNQTMEEKAQNIMRLNWIELRESEFHPSTCLYVGQCFKLGRPFCCACL